MYESRQRSKKQQKVSQNHEHIIRAEQDEVDGDAKEDRHRGGWRLGILFWLLGLVRCW